MRTLNFARLWLSGWIASMVAALVVCLLPMPPLPGGVDHADKLGHAVGFALLMLYAAQLFVSRRRLLQAIAGLLLLGLLIELLQAMLPWRSADLVDLLADAAGIAFGAVFAATPAARMLCRVDRWLSLRLRAVTRPG